MNVRNLRMKKTTLTGLKPIPRRNRGQRKTSRTKSPSLIEHCLPIKLRLCHDMAVATLNGRLRFFGTIKTDKPARIPVYARATTMRIKLDFYEIPRYYYNNGNIVHTCVSQQYSKHSRV